MNNLQDLLDYQTQYLLWAIGTVLDPKKFAERESHVSEILSGSSFLEDLRQMDVFHSDLPHLDREILEWHRSKGDELLSRVAAPINQCLHGKLATSHKVPPRDAAAFSQQLPKTTPQDVFDFRSEADE